MICTLSASNICKKYGNRNVVNDVDISVTSGEIVGILGPNGAGKTTTFYSIIGLIPIDSGKITLQNIDISRMPMHKRARLGLGYLPQECSVFKNLSVYDNLLIVAEHINLLGKNIDKTILNMLDELGILHLKKQKAYTLSGGERRRLEIARALITNPKILLLDEPFSGVDPISVTDIQNIMLHLKEKDIGILITDHNVRETLSIVDKAYLIHDGKVICEGDSKTLLNDPKTRTLYLGERFSM